MKNAIFTVLATLSLTGMAQADGRPGQAPMPPQAPEVREVKAKVCKCSLTGVCTCSPGDDCGCVADEQFRWIETSKPGHVALYKGLKQLGNWRHEEGLFYWLVEDGGDTYHWSLATCPVDPPAKATATPKPKAVPVQSIVPQRMSYAPAMSGFSGGSGGACRS